jgi:NAD(P)-dependent dehydrogenase (short-subunit alcohol dehydrogenase family)
MLTLDVEGKFFNSGLPAGGGAEDGLQRTSNFLIEQFGFGGQTAIFIGTTGEIGRSIAEGLCRAGANTVVVGRNVEAREERAAAFSDLPDAGDATFVRCDTTSKSNLRALIAEVEDQFGRIDVLVNSAGVNAATPFFEIEEEEWDHIMNVNLKGVFLACQVVGEYLLEQGEGGSIINVNSMTALTPLSKVFTYGASKGGANQPLGEAGAGVGAGGHPRQLHRAQLLPRRAEPRNLVGGAHQRHHAADACGSVRGGRRTDQHHALALPRQGEFLHYRGQHCGRRRLFVEDALSEGTRLCVRLPSEP